MDATSTRSAELGRAELRFWRQIFAENELQKGRRKKKKRERRESVVDQQRPLSANQGTKRIFTLFFIF